MKQNHFKSTLKVAAALALTGIGAFGTASAQTQQNNQIALQLGAIQLGYTTNSSWSSNPQLLANALIQGQQALLAKTTNVYTSYVPPATNAPVAQSTTFRAQLYEATLAALTNPITNLSSSKVTVNIVNGKTGKASTVKATLSFNPTLTTPTAILAIVTARVPDLGPGLASNAVAASVAYTTNSAGVVFPVFGTQPSASSVAKATNAQAVLSLNEKTSATQISNAAAVAKATLTAAVKAYVSGTTQWAAVPKTGPATNGVYLPNFGTKSIGPTGNPQAANLTGLADAASAVAANAINGLGVINTNSTTNSSGLYGKTAANVQTIAKALTQAAASFQKTSTTSTAGVPFYVTGSVGAESLGLITQVAGVDNSTWGGTGGTNGVTAILNGVVSGAVAGVGKTSPNVAAVILGVSEGFYATYLATYTGGGTPLSATAFGNANLNAMESAFTSAGVSLNSTLSGDFGKGFNQVYLAATTGGAVITNPSTWNYGVDPIPGAKGINYFKLVNGVGSPVTDTIGL